MSPFRKFFDSLSRPAVRGSKSTRRRRRRRQDAKLRGGEQLEAKQLLAVTSLADIPTQDLAGEPAALKLSTYFDENTVSGTVVKFETSASTPLPADQKDFFVELTDNTPTTKQNFLSYVNDGSYDGTMIHRSIDGFIVEGGAYTAPLVDANLSGSTPGIVQPKGAIVNEPGNSNVRGTISMSRLSGVTNSASNRFYFNINDNSALLDGVDGGDTAFGNVLGSGMAVLDVMNNALTYSGDSYYAELGEAAKDLEFLPIWNLDGDGIIKPADFLKFDSVAQVSEDALMSFAISFDGQPTSSKVTSQIVNGELVLTPVAGQNGTVNVTVSASSTIDAGASPLVKTFAVNVGPGELTAIEEIGNTFLYSNQNGYLYAGTTAIIGSDGQQLTTSTYASFNYSEVNIRAESINGKNYVLFQNTSSNNLWSHEVDGSWIATGANTVLSAGTSSFYDAEIDFGIDSNGDTYFGALVHENGGAIVSEHTDGRLLANNKLISINSSPINRATYSALGYSEIRTALVDGSNQILFVKPNRSLGWNWILDGAGDQASQSVISFGSQEFYSAEVTFDIDVNGDTAKGLPSLTIVESSGSTTLSQDIDGNLFIGGAAVMNGDVQMRLQQYSQWNYNGIAAEIVDGENRIVLTNSNSGVIWETVYGSSSLWKFTSQKNVHRPGKASYYEAEQTYNVDANQDGSIGTPVVSELSNKGVAVSSDSENYIFINGSPLQRGTGSVKTDSYSQYGYTNYYAVSNGDGITLFVEHPGRKFWKWNLDSNLNFISDTLERRGTTGFFDAEIELNIDSNTDGSIGLPALSDYETAGDTTIQFNPSTNAIFINSKPIFRQGQAVTVNQFSSFGYTDVTAERNQGVNNIIFRKQNVLWTWQMTADWTAVADESVITPDSTQFFDLEAVHGFDGNSDGVSGNLISTIGGTKLTKTADGRLYADTNPVKRSGQTLTTSTYAGFGYEEVIAGTVDGQKVVALKKTNNVIWEWNVDDTWNWQSDVGTHSVGSARQIQLLSLFD